MCVNVHVWYAVTRQATDEREAVARSMSSAPFTLTRSCWKRSSIATFLRSRRKRVSMRGDWPRTGVYISAESITEKLAKEGLQSMSLYVPMTMLATSQTISPNRGSETYFNRSRNIGSRSTSSRPAKAVRRPSRWMSSWINEKVVVGGTCCSKCLALSNPSEYVQ